MLFPSHYYELFNTIAGGKPRKQNPQYVKAPAGRHVCRNRLRPEIKPQRGDMYVIEGFCGLFNTIMLEGLQSVRGNLGYPKIIGHCVGYKWLNAPSINKN